MQPLDIRNRLRKQPFQPFRLCLTDGTSYVVMHPELLMLGKRSAMLGIAEPADVFYDQAIDIDLRHIVCLEPADTAKSMPPEGTTT